jgi:hypothetical protein
MVRQWALEAGRGLAPAEGFKVMYLVRRDDPKRAPKQVQEQE